MSGQDADEPRRMFVALMLDREVGRRLLRVLGARLSEAADRPLPRLRRYDPPDLHATLFFLGRVTPGSTTALEERLQAAVSGAPALDLALDRTGAFPRRGGERVLWAGVRDRAGGPLAELRRRVREAAVAAGFADDGRPWEAHVTLARVRKGRGPSAIPDAFYQELGELAWRPREVALVRTLPPGGPRAYRALRGFPLP